MKHTFFNTITSVGLISFSTFIYYVFSIYVDFFYFFFFSVYDFLPLNIIERVGFSVFFLLFFSLVYINII